MSDETLFHRALEKPVAERSAFLEQACAGDTSLRHRVEALLRSHETPDSFLVGARGEAGGDRRLEFRSERGRRRSSLAGAGTDRPELDRRGPGQPDRPVQAPPADRRGGHGHGLHGRADRSRCGGRSR